MYEKISKTNVRMSLLKVMKFVLFFLSNCANANHDSTTDNLMASNDSFVPFYSNDSYPYPLSSTRSDRTLLKQYLTSLNISKESVGPDNVSLFQ